MRALLLMFLLVGGLRAQGKHVWITIGSEAVAGIQKHLVSRGFQAKDLAAEGGVSVLEVEENLLRTISLYMHDNFNKCAGFKYHDSAAEALAAMTHVPVPLVAKRVAFTLNNPTVVNALIAEVTEQGIIDTIQSLSAHYTRYYTTQSGRAAAVDLTNDWQAILSGRSDGAVAQFSHS